MRATIGITWMSRQRFCSCNARDCLFGRWAVVALKRHVRMALSVSVGVLLAALLAPAALADTAPGDNGRLAFGNHSDTGGGGIGTVDPTTNAASYWPGLDDVWVRELSWAPRGGKLAFAGLPCTEESGYDCEPRELYVVDSDGTGLQRLTNTPTEEEVSPDWSPDGGWIAYERRYPAAAPALSEIWVRRADGTGAHTLSSIGTAHDHDPSWSPDGTKLAFASERDGNREIYVMNVDGSSHKRLTTDPATDSDPAWSPDGSRIAWARAGEIWSMSSDGTDRVQLTKNGVNDWNPSWSPDGKRIAFISDRVSSPYTFDGHNVMSMDPDGSAEKMHTDFQLGTWAINVSWERLNRAPTAAVSLTTTAPFVGSPVTWAAAASDSDGHIAAVDWDLDEDGAFDDATGPTASLVPAPARGYRVGVRVRDDEGVLTFAYGGFVAAPAPSTAPVGVPTTPSGGGVLGDRAAPVVRYRLAARPLGASLRRGLPIRLELGEAARVSVAARLSRTDARRLELFGNIARASTTLKARGSARLMLRFTNRARRRLARQKSIAIVVRIAATDAAGNVRRRTSRVVLDR
jgi:hypothetical protein